MQSTFENFNPSSLDSFGYARLKQAVKGIDYQNTRTGYIEKMTAQIDIKIENNIKENFVNGFDNKDVKIELFNPFRSIAFAANRGLSLKTPVDAFDISLMESDGCGILSNLLNDKIFFDKEGNLIFTSRSYDNGNGFLKISCRQIPYVALIRSIGIQPFYIEKIRLSVLSVSQTAQNFVHVYDSFLGSKHRNNISPLTYLAPSQYQNKIVDIPLSLKIDGERGLEYTMNGFENNNVNEIVTLSIFISRYYKHTLKPIK
jgi:hypothetical protein